MQKFWLQAPFKIQIWVNFMLHISAYLGVLMVPVLAHLGSILGPIGSLAWVRQYPRWQKIWPLMFVTWKVGKKAQNLGSETKKNGFYANCRGFLAHLGSILGPLGSLAWVRKYPRWQKIWPQIFCHLERSLNGQKIGFRVIKWVIFAKNADFLVNFCRF